MVEVLVNHATALLELKRLDEALAGFDRVVALDPENAVGWNNRANTLVALERLEEAASCYDRALQIRPDLETAKSNRFLVLLQLRKVSRIADFALRDMFDEVATRFDHLMVEGLDYRGHLHLRTLADAKLPRLKPPLRVLDLGCGTGLVGNAFKDLAAGGRLDGIDLAPRMLEVARKRGIYDDLILGDLETVLAAPGPSYDLIVSADTMVYLGDLAPTFRGVFNRLNPGGFYLFAVRSEGRGRAGSRPTSAASGTARRISRRRRPVAVLCISHGWTAPCATNGKSPCRASHRLAKAGLATGFLFWSGTWRDIFASGLRFS